MHFLNYALINYALIHSVLNRVVYEFDMVILSFLHWSLIAPSLCDQAATVVQHWVMHFG